MASFVKKGGLFLLILCLCAIGVTAGTSIPRILTPNNCVASSYQATFQCDNTYDQDCSGTEGDKTEWIAQTLDNFQFVEVNLTNTTNNSIKFNITNINLYWSGTYSQPARFNLSCSNTSNGATAYNAAIHTLIYSNTVDLDHSVWASCAALPFTQINFSVVPDTCPYLAIMVTKMDGSAYSRFDEVTVNGNYLEESTPPPTAGSITATDYNDGSSINTFSVTLTNASGNFDFSTTNGTVSPGLFDVYNITFYSTTHYNISNTSINLSSGYVFRPHQAEITISALEIITNKSLTGTFNTTGNTSTSFMFTKAGNIYITFVKAGYVSKTQNFTITAKTNTTQTITDVYASWINITARDNYDNSAIQNYSIQLSNGTYTLTYSTTNGTINFNFINDTWNLLYYGYGFNVSTSLAGVNTTIHKVVNANTSFVNVTAYEIITSTLLSPITLTSGSQVSSNGLLLTKGGVSNTITVNKSTYYNNTLTITPGLATTSQNITYMFNALLNVSAKDMNGNNISNFSFNISQSNYSYNYFFQTTTGNISVPLIATLNYSYKARGNNLSYINGTIVPAIGFANLQLLYYTFNAINFHFLDEILKTLMAGTTINTELISDSYAVNDSTNTGDLYIDLLVPETYTIRYSATGFATRFYQFTLINETFTNITLYMLNSTSSTDVTFYVYDEYGNSVERALIYVMRYDIATNSYLTTQILTTDSQGKAIGSLTLNSEFYQFIIKDSALNIRKQTVPAIVTDTSITFRINLQDEIATKFYTTNDNITYSLSFNNATNTFRYQFTDATNTITKGCLRVTKVSGSQDTLINESCTESTTGINYVTVSALNDTTYRAIASVYFGGYQAYVASTYKEFKDADVFAQYGLFLDIILTFVFIFIGRWNPLVAAIMMPLPTIFLSYVGMIPLPLSYAFGIAGIMAVVAWYFSDRA